MSSAAKARDELLRAVRELMAGTLSAADLTLQLDAALSGLNLYPPEAVLDMGHAAGQIIERQPELAVNAILQLMSSDSRETRAVACAVISRLARYSPAVWASMVRHFATDADWEVRSFAARAYDSREGYSGAVEFHTEWVFEELAAWVKENHYLLRHAAAEALLGYVQMQPDVIPRVLKLLDPLLSDSAEYVRRGHVMALRTMGRKQAPVVLDYIETHLSSVSDEARESIELVLEDSFAARNPERKNQLLGRLNAEQSQK